MMARFKGFFVVFAVAIWANLCANEWLLSRDNVNRTAQMGPYNTPKIQSQIATNPAQNSNENLQINAIRITNLTPNCNQKSQNCFIKRCTNYRQIPKQQAISQYQPIRQKIAIQMPLQAQPQIQVPQQIRPQIQPVPQTESATESKNTLKSTPKPQITPQANPKAESKRNTATAKSNQSAISNLECNEPENPCGAYECIYNIGPCRKSEPKIQSKLQPKAWIDEMQLKDLPN